MEKLCCRNVVISKDRMNVVVQGPFPWRVEARDWSMLHVQSQDLSTSPKVARIVDQCRALIIITILSSDLWSSVEEVLWERDLEMWRLVRRKIYIWDDYIYIIFRFPLKVCWFVRKRMCEAETMFKTKPGGAWYWAATSNLPSQRDLKSKLKETWSFMPYSNTKIGEDEIHLTYQRNIDSVGTCLNRSTSREKGNEQFSLHKENRWSQISAENGRFKFQCVWWIPVKPSVHRWMETEIRGKCKNGIKSISVGTLWLRWMVMWSLTLYAKSFPSRANKTKSV